MVSFQDWVRIAFEVAEQKGFRPARPGGQITVAGGRAFTENNKNALAMRVFAELWNEHKVFLGGATEQEARDFAHERINVE